MNETIKRLPESEEEVMLAVWDCVPPAARADIEKQLRPRRAMAATTVLTLLSRLTEKGFLAAERKGKGNVYRPLISREEYLAQESRSFLDRLCGGDVRAFAAALCDGGLSRREIEELRRALERDEL